MTGKTHAMVGANAIWVAYFLGAVDQSAPLLVAAGALAALLPDIDARGRGAKIHYMFKGVLGAFKNTFRHRGFFHSFLATLIVFLISMVTLWRFNPLLPVIVTLGYVSHPIIDAFNAEVQYFFPLPKFMSFVPKSFRFRVGSAPDFGIFFLASIGVVGFFLINMEVFQVVDDSSLLDF